MKRMLGLVVAGVLLAACGSKESAPVAPPPPPADALPAGLLLPKAPEGAPVGVGDLKKSAKEGQEVVLRARVGGTKAPFVDGRAVMTVADVGAITSCAEMDMGEDGCSTPWDYCCTPKDVLLANTATVRVAGPDGQALKGGLRGWKGIEPLKVVVVRGVVGPRPEAGVLVIDAKGIFVEQ